MEKLETAKKYRDYMVSMRRYFHENPELSGQEYHTVETISKELSDMGIEHTVVKDGGVLGFIKGKKDSGKTVLLRADCDALPVTEKENLSKSRVCWSKNPGVMHACGHDGHTAMLLGAAKILLDHIDEIEGTVILCFERGEEGAGNVKYIFKYMEDNGIRPDSCFGMHVNVEIPTGQIAINDTDMLAGAMAFDITIEGNGGHGSRPDQANNPIDCFVAIYQRLEALRLTKIDPFKTCTYSVGVLNSGNVGNVIPQTLRFAGTMRCFDTDGVGMKFYEEFRKLVDDVCAAYGCKAVYNSYTLPGFATVNDPDYSRFARKVLSIELGRENVIVREPMMGSESYSQYLRQFPGLFTLLGVLNPDKGVGAPNHNEAFDIDEDALVYGAACHARYAVEFLKNKEELHCGKKMSFRECLEVTGKQDDIKLLYGEN